jgi:hypothetical protein
VSELTGAPARLFERACGARKLLRETEGTCALGRLLQELLGGAGIVSGLGQGIAQRDLQAQPRACIGGTFDRLHAEPVEVGGFLVGEQPVCVLGSTACIFDRLAASPPGSAAQW